MYINESYCFTTLAIGKKYIERCNTLIQSVLKFTAVDIYVLTDDPSAFSNYGNRVHIINITHITDDPFNINHIFNYNLKYYPIKYCVENTSNDVIIYMDSDSFLFGWSNNFMYDVKDLHGIIARCRDNISNMMHDRTVHSKVSALQQSDVNFPLVIENILILQRDYRTVDFIKRWADVIQLSIAANCTPYMEAVELGIAAANTSMKIHDINYRSFSDNFRTLHHDKIHTPLIS